MSISNLQDIFCALNIYIFLEKLDFYYFSECFFLKINYRGSREKNRFIVKKLEYKYSFNPISSSVFAQMNPSNIHIKIILQCVS